MLIRFLHWLRTNLGSVILALVLSVTVWVAATLEGNPFIEADYRSPIEIDLAGLDPDHIITNDYTRTTRVRLRAQEETWASISADDIVVTADLSGLEPGTHQVGLDVQVLVPQVRLISATPAQIRIDIEQRGERELPIRLDVDGQPSVGYSANEPELTPEVVTVRGPLSYVDLVAEVQANVSVEGKRDSFRGEVALLALDSEGNRVDDVTISPATVYVTVPISQVEGYKYVSIIPRTTGRPAAGYYVSNVAVTPSQIVLQGPPDVLNNMQPYIETNIDVTGLTDDVIVEVTLNLPPGVIPIDQEPIEALVSIAAQPGSRAVVARVRTIGLEEGLAVELAPEEIEVILSGPLPVLDALDVNRDITVTLDLTNLTIGTYQVEPKVEVRQGEIVIESFFPAVIEVSIIRATPTPPSP